MIILILIEVFGFEFHSSQFSQSYDKVISITGTVSSVRVKSYYTALNVKCGGENVLVKLSDVTDSAIVYSLAGREITATGMLTKPSGARNPGCFDYEKYLKARNCYAIMDVSQFKLFVGKIKNPINNFLSVKKGLFYERASAIAGAENSSLLFGILFGEKGYMDDELYSEFKDNGIAHVLAVSGLHVGLIYSVIRSLLKRKDLAADILIILLLICYSALSNFSVSVLRAGIMILLRIYAFHSMRRYDMLSAACFTAMLMLFINPWYIYDSGMQLSFMAAYSLAVLLPYFDIKFKKLCDKKRSERLYKIGSFFLPGLVLQIGMVPLTAYHFLNFSPLALILNPPAIYLASLLLPVGLLAFLLSPFKIFLAGMLNVSNALCMMLKGLSALGDKVLHGISVPAPPFSLLLLYYTLLFFFFSEGRHLLLRMKKDSLVITMSLALAVSSCIFPYVLGISQSILPWKYNSYDAVFVDVGQGDCIHVQSEGVNILIDGGGSYYSDVAENTLKPYLLKNGISEIDIAFVTHLDSDHSKGIEDLSALMKIKQIAFPKSVEGSDVSGFKTDKICFLDEGSVITAGDAIFTVISASGGDENSAALVMLCDVGGSRLLLLSDIPEEKESELVSNGLCGFDIDVLKVAHHGSKYSTGEKLIKSNNITYAVISCGKNNRYGHPAERVLEVLESSGIIIRRTDKGGAVCIRQKNIL